MTTSDKPGRTGPVSDRGVQVKSEQVRLLYSQSLIAALATAFAAVVLVYIQWPVIDHSTLYIWLACMSVIVAARMASYFVFFQKERKLSEATFWERLFLSIVVLAAFIWGSAGIFLFPEGEYERQAATVVILAGMAAGAVTTFSALRRPVFIFLPFTMMPLTIHLFLEATSVTIALAFACIAYTIFLLGSANQTYRAHLQNITQRIKSSESERVTRKSEQTLLKTSEILKMIATGKPASDIYDTIALMYEARHPGMRCSMLILAGNKLMHGGAPSLPESYCDAVNGLEYGPSVGSCGTSTYFGERVLVEDIATDPKWDKLKHVALPHGLRSCWSEPIKDAAGEVLGAFGMYYNHPALPDGEELADLESAARLAGIIMERERREAALLHSENKYRTLVENLPQRFFLKDRDSLFVSCSKNLAADLGITPEQIVGTSDADYFPSDMAEHYRQDDQRVMQSGITEHIEEKILIDGEERVIHTVKAPALDEHGNVDGVLGIFWDVTEQRLLEESFQQAQKMESVGTLVGGVAHEFNNTLAGITGRLYLAKIQAEDNPELIRHIDQISVLSYRAADMIQQLLAFSRKSPVTMKPFDLKSFIKETFKLHRFSIPENITIETDFSSGPLPVYGDSTQIQQVLVNLLHNARDAVSGVKNPQITVTLELFKADALFTQLHPGLSGQRLAHLAVEDNGCGISEENRDKIFDPFFTTKEVGKGTGLGLSMAYGAIQTHRGLIEVDAAREVGSKVHVYIPLSSSLTKHEQQDDLKVHHGKGECILLVDDESELRSVCSEIIESLGYTFMTAANGSEAVEAYAANKESIAMILMDVVMPVMGGVDAALAIKAMNKDAKIIFLYRLRYAGCS